MNESAQDDAQPEQIGQLLDTPGLAGALESERFKQFLDHLPVAIAVSALQPSECIIYANVEFEQLSGRTSQAIVGESWRILPGTREGHGKDEPLGDAIVDGSDFIGTFVIRNRDDAPRRADAWSNLIEDDEGTPTFRLVALTDAHMKSDLEHEDVEQRIREKDTLLRELQHRVQNNLQMITALIRLEARNVPDAAYGERFDRLAGRVESLALLYRALSDENLSEEVDLGVYLGQVASAVMTAHAVEGIRLELKVDTWPVSVNVAMPAGLVVNELMTNALKHAFEGRDGGTIKLHSLVDDVGCKVIVADDGVGLPSGAEWPERGKLSALIVTSLRENAKAQLEVDSTPGLGTTVTLRFTRAAAIKG
jgi:two-component sensor histidine kinase